MLRRTIAMRATGAGAMIFGIGMLAPTAGFLPVLVPVLGFAAALIAIALHNRSQHRPQR